MRLAPLVAILLLAACGSSDTSKEAVPAVDSTTDTASSFSESCPFDSGVVGSLTLKSTAVPTVFEVTVDSPEPISGRVLVVDAAGEVRTVAAETTDGLHHTALVLGLQSNLEYEVWWEGTTGAGERYCDRPQELVTATFPADLPPVFSMAFEENRTAGYHLLPIMTENASVVSIVNSDAEMVWGVVLATRDDDDDDDDDDEGDDDDDGDFSPGQAFRMHLDPLNRGVLVNTQGHASTDDGHVYLVTWAGETERMATFPGGHTDFVVLPDGSYAMLGWQVRELEGRRILGDTVLIHEPDGTVRPIWSSFRTFHPDLARTYFTGFTGDDPPVEDWSHVNSLSYDAADDAFLVTVTEPAAVVKIDRETGEATWVVSYNSPDFDDTPWDLVEMPHSAQSVEGGVVVFNRTHPEDPTTCSHMADISLDLEGRAATRSGYWESESCRKNGFLGGAERLDNGHSVVTWSSYGLLEEVDTNGETVLQLALPLGAGFGFGTYATELPGVLQ